MGLRVTAGKNYEDIVSWARRMTLTGICSEGIVYFAGRKVWVSDTFHVFDRFVSVGNPLPDGSLADKHYVWLSDWQLENINNNHLLPFDFEAYKQLRNHIAKILVPLLQMWLFASRESGCFEKRYRDHCQLLNIRKYPHLSKVKEKLGPSLDELTRHHYLSGWRIGPTTNGDDLKIVLYPGDRFKRSLLPIQHKRLLPSSNDNAQTANISQLSSPRIDRELLFQLMKRGVTEKGAINLLKSLPPDQAVMDQLEWGDYLLASSAKGRFFNPAGLYIHLVKENAILPDSFETSRKRRLREAAKQALEREEQQQAAVELAYLEYQKQQLDDYIQFHFSREEWEAMMKIKKQELLEQVYWRRIFAGKQDLLNKAAEQLIRREVSGQVKLMSFSEFREMKRKH